MAKSKYQFYGITPDGRLGEEVLAETDRFRAVEKIRNQFPTLDRFAIVVNQKEEAGVGFSRGAE
jgi:hypothetical protein